MIFGLLIIHNHGRKSPITRVPRATWRFFISYIPDHNFNSPKVVKKAIMTDINDLVQEFWRTSSEGAVGESFFEMRRLYEILEVYLKVSLYSSVFALPSTWLIIIPPSGTFTKPNPEPNLRHCLMGIERCLISHYLNPKIWVTC